MSDPILMFVYGTLKNGYGNHHLMRNCEFLGEATLKPTMVGRSVAAMYCMVETGPPVVTYLRQNIENFIGPKFKLPNWKYSPVGEVYSVPLTELPYIDSLEGHPDVYRREQVDIEGYGKCWVYMICRDNLRLIDKVVVDGVYRGWRQQPTYVSTNHVALMEEYYRTLLDTRPKSNLKTPSKDKTTYKSTFDTYNVDEMLARFNDIIGRNEEPVRFVEDE